MERHFVQSGPSEVIQPEAHSSCEWAHLVRKLRWIGLGDDAKRLETVISMLPAEQRATVSFGPFSAD